MTLPSMPNRDRIRQNVQIQFYGLNHTRAAEAGLYDMVNITGDDFPLISSRPPRYKVAQIEKPNGLFSHNGLWWASGTRLYHDGVLVSDGFEDSYKTFAAVDDRLIVFPDKKLVRAYQVGGNTAYAVIPMEATAEGTCDIEDGTIYGEEATANTLHLQSGAWPFAPGDGVKITGATDDRNNLTLVVQEVDGAYLRFADNSFHSTAQGQSLSVKREVPDLDFIFMHANRLWGCKGDQIWCSAQGNPSVFYDLQGLGNSAWATDTGTPGNFTGACSFLGYPTFFKEDYIFRVYGEYPANYGFIQNSTMGVMEGSGKSLAIAGDVLFYLGRSGFIRYTGGHAATIHDAFGEWRYQNAVAGSDGLRYYVRATQGGGDSLLVYDTRTQAWFKQDTNHAVDFAWAGDLYWLDAVGNLWLEGNPRSPRGTIEDPLTIRSMAELADFTNRDPNRKGTGKLLLRMGLDPGASVRVRMQFDGGWTPREDIWTDVAEVRNDGTIYDTKRTYTLPIIPRRSDHYRIRIEGTGGWTLYSLTREEYSGSEVH